MWNWFKERGRKRAEAQAARRAEEYRQEVEKMHAEAEARERASRALAAETRRTTQDRIESQVRLARPVLPRVDAAHQSQGRTFRPSPGSSDTSTPDVTTPILLSTSQSHASPPAKSCPAPVDSTPDTSAACSAPSDSGSSGGDGGGGGGGGGD